MSINHMKQINHWMCAAAVMTACGLASGVALGQDGALGGPKVENNAPPAVESSFTNSMEAARTGVSLNLNQFMRAVRTLSGEDVAPELRLTDAQETALRDELRSHRQATAEYMQPFREEMAELQAKMGTNERRQGVRASDAPRARATEGNDRVRRDLDRRGNDAGDGQDADGMEARQGGGGGDRARQQNERPQGRQGQTDRAAAPEVSEKERAAATARMREIRRGGPQVEDLQRRVWSHLTKPQQAFADETVKKALAQAERAQMDRLVNRELQKMQREDGEFNIDRLMARLPEQIRARLEAMTPEQREAAIKKLMERRTQDRAQDGNNTQRRGAQRDRNRPPAMDDVELPDPD